MQLFARFLRYNAVNIPHKGDYRGFIYNLI